MESYYIAKPPQNLLPEPDPAATPNSSLDAAALLKIDAELGGWAKVRVEHLAPQPGTAPALAGWIPRNLLVAIERAEPAKLKLFAEPLGGAPQEVEARIVRTLVDLGSWRKVLGQKLDGGALTGWIEGKASPLQPAAAITQPTLALGVNEVYRGALLEAEQTTGISALALAAMIDAEAGVIRSGPDKGKWDAQARNAKTEASGLTQFLASTWAGHAEIAGTTLNLQARRDGLVTANGKVEESRRGELLQLRFDPRLSIISAAEYGAANLKGLIKAGLVATSESDDRKAWCMYLAHHEGLTGAIGFLRETKTYTLGNLTTQVGAEKAAELTANEGGDANRAYRRWLTGYINLKIRPAKFLKVVSAGFGGSLPPIGIALPISSGSASANPEEVRAYPELDTDTKAVLGAFAGPVLPFPLVGSQVPLARAIQQALSVHGYLDPPADGEFGPVSIWALTAFCRKAGLNPDTGLTPDLAIRLARPDGGLPDITAGDDWLGKVIRFMRASGYFICRHPECWNIVYVEGMSPGGQLNADLPNQFNDLRIVFRILENGIPESHAWEATTEPGNHWTDNPMDPAGAARIAFRQFKSWAVGKHLASKPSGHEGLVQVKEVTVHRDLNRDHKRTGDRVFRGLFGINQHWGYDAPQNDIRDTSAGCLVGRTKDGHREFMALVKGDARFKASKAYRFVSAILPGDQLGL